jgi:hypothetical protein
MESVVHPDILTGHETNSSRLLYRVIILASTIVDQTDAIAYLHELQPHNQDNSDGM